MQSFFYLLQQTIRIIMNTTTAIISKAGFIIIYPTIRNKAIKPTIFPIAPMPDQSP